MTSPEAHTAVHATNVSRIPVLVRCIAALFILATSTAAQVREAELKAMFLEAAVRFITWPSDTAEVSHLHCGTFTIGYSERDAFARQLYPFLLRKTIKDRPVRFLDIGNRRNMDSCDIILIPESTGNEIDNLISRVNGKPVLTVCDNPELVGRGVILGIGTEERKISCHINSDNARQSKLRFSHHLLRKSTVITGGETSQ